MIMDKLEEKFESKVLELPEKDQKVFLTMKTVLFSGYNMIKPILIAIAMIWFFLRLKNVVGMDEVIFYQNITFIILLRMILSKLS